MQSGRLKKRLVLQSKTESQDEYGAPIISWTTEATVWGSLLPLRGQELFAQQQLQPETKVRVVIRYYAGIDSTWRIVHGGKYYDIESIINENKRNRTLTIMCREGVSEDVGPVVGGNALLLESGSYLLLESGDKLLLEA